MGIDSLVVLVLYACGTIGLIAVALRSVQLYECREIVSGRARKPEAIHQQP